MCVPLEDLTANIVHKAMNVTGPINDTVNSMSKYILSVAVDDLKTFITSQLDDNVLIYLVPIETLTSVNQLTWIQYYIRKNNMGYSFDFRTEGSNYYCPPDSEVAICDPTDRRIPIADIVIDARDLIVYRVIKSDR